MGWDVATNTEPVARKEYRCDASEWINNMMDLDDFTSEELGLFDTARTEGFKILKGSKYLKTTGFWDGEPSVFRARPEMDVICRKYNLYSD